MDIRSVRALRFGGSLVYDIMFPSLLIIRRYSIEQSLAEQAAPS